jgi:hypothetical protein
MHGIEPGRVMLSCPPLKRTSCAFSAKLRKACSRLKLLHVLNKQLRPDRAHATVEVAKHLKDMTDQVAQLPDGRWMLKQLML